MNTNKTVELRTSAALDIVFLDPLRYSKLSLLQICRMRAGLNLEVSTLGMNSVVRVI